MATKLKHAKGYPFRVIRNNRVAYSKILNTVSPVEFYVGRINGVIEYVWNSSKEDWDNLANEGQEDRRVPIQVMLSNGLFIETVLDNIEWELR